MEQPIDVKDVIDTKISKRVKLELLVKYVVHLIDVAKLAGSVNEAMTTMNPLLTKLSNDGVISITDIEYIKQRAIKSRLNIYSTEKRSVKLSENLDACVLDTIDSVVMGPETGLKINEALTKYIVALRAYENAKIEILMRYDSGRQSVLDMLITYEKYFMQGFISQYK